MSGNQLTLIPIALLLPPANSNFTPGQAQVPLFVGNSDGTAPTLALTPPSATSPVATAAVMADANGDGNYLLVITAQSVGTGTLTVSADGIPNLGFALTVANSPDETVTAGPITILPPAPSDAMTASAGAGPAASPSPAAAPAAATTPAAPSTGTSEAASAAIKASKAVS